MDNILIVDDVEINRIILREILCNDYSITEAENGFQAIEILFNAEELPSAVLLDIMMPGIDGFEVLEMIKSNVRTSKIPVLFITAADSSTHESRGLKEGAADYVTKPFNPDVIKARIDNNIQLNRYREGLETMLEKKTAELVATHERTLETLATIVEYRSLESGTHIRRSGELTKILIHALLKDPKYAKQLLNTNYNSMIKAVALHDIGKVGIPDSILLKPGALTDEEFNVIKGHSKIGYDIIKTIDDSDSDDDDAIYFRHCKDICLCHHERWDGKGYPNELKGEEIPLSARIVSVVDVYDALTNRRCYKPPLSHEEAINLLVSGAGTQFDPNIVKIVAEDLSEQFRELELRLGDTD